eukprot:3627146-Rhodomonas_salina.1
MEAPCCMSHERSPAVVGHGGALAQEVYLQLMITAWTANLRHEDDLRGLTEHNTVRVLQSFCCRT